MNDLKIEDFKLTPEDVCKMLNYHDPSYVRDLARYGKIPALKIGRFWKFNEGQIIEHINEQTKKAVKKKD